jgi:hypothetical protein
MSADLFGDEDETTVRPGSSDGGGRVEMELTEGEAEGGGGDGGSQQQVAAEQPTVSRVHACSQASERTPGAGNLSDERRWQCHLWRFLDAEKRQVKAGATIEKGGTRKGRSGSASMTRTSFA